MKLVLFIFSLVFVANGFGQKEKKQKEPREEQVYQINDELQYVYQKPRVFGFITSIPKNYVGLGKETVKKENLKWFGLTASTTMLLIAADERLLDASENLQHLGIEENHKYAEVADGAFSFPQNSASALYYLGHGNTSFLIGAGFLITGGIKKNYRAIHTSSEILEGILTLGVLTQGLKRVFGRESPYVSTTPRGKWSGFPGWKEYAKNTPHYDAMPSGHIATLTSTVTILSKNYPNVKWIRPVGYTLIGVLGIEMMNSGVHWASDYPLGILIGYSVGSIVANGKIKKVQPDNFSENKVRFTPHLVLKSSYGDNLIGVGFTF